MCSLTPILLNVAPMINVTYLMYVVRTGITGRAIRADDDEDDDDGGSELEKAHLESDSQCIGILLPDTSKKEVTMKTYH